MILRPCSPPPGLFKGVNIMTRDIIGYYKLRDERYAELSQGEGMQREPIFGVTVRPEPPNKLSKLCFSRKEAEDYIKEMS